LPPPAPQHCNNRSVQQAIKALIGAALTGASG